MEASTSILLCSNSSFHFFPATEVLMDSTKATAELGWTIKPSQGVSEKNYDTSLHIGMFCYNVTMVVIINIKEFINSLEKMNIVYCLEKVKINGFWLIYRI